MIRKFFCIVAVVLAGLIAGLLLGTGMDQYTHRELTATAWVTEHQGADALFRQVLPMFWNAALLMLVIATVIAKGYGRWLFGAATVLLLISLVMTLRVEVPMNRLIATWNPATPPANWADIRDEWMTFHVQRTACAVVAFVCATVGLTKIRANVKRY